MGRKIDINQQTLDITVYDDDGCGDPPKTWDNSCVKHIAYRATPNDDDDDDGDGVSDDGDDDGDHNWHQ